MRSHLVPLAGRIRPELAMAAGTALSRLTGLGRVFALSYALGISPLADAYNLANTTPNMIYDLVLGGVLSATLVPVFVAKLQSDRGDRGKGGERSGDQDQQDDGWAGVSAVLTVCLAVLLVITVLVVAAAGPLMHGYTLAAPRGTAGVENATAVRLLRLFAPQVLLYGVIALVTAVLNSIRRFALATFAPIANNLALIALLLGLSGPLHRAAQAAGSPTEPRLLLLLGLGTTAGVAAQALVLAAGVSRSGARLRWRWAPRDAAVRQVAGLSGWTFAMVAANQAALFAVLLLANSRPGGVSAYTYAYTFFQVPFGVVAVSITGARQPAWAADWAAGRIRELRTEVAGGLRLLVLLMVPIAAVLAALADPIVRLLLGHGATGATGATLTGQVLAVLAMGLPGFSAYLYYVRVFQALRDLRSAFGLYVLNNGLMVLLALALYRPFGVQGVAAAVSVAYTAAALAAAAVLRRRIGAVPAEPAVLGALTRAVATSLPAGALAWLKVRSMEPGLGVGAMLPLLAGLTVAAAALPLCLSLASAGPTRLLGWGRRAAAPAGSPELTAAPEPLPGPGSLPATGPGTSAGRVRSTQPRRRRRATRPPRKGNR
ncbi:putative peptidoglycan lipid II flippase [Kitasatospora sp. GAS204A]|uniref:murein biosynthesis integral membrane protein MurJ n=1 Tax=unclassified Kitasatospora TaxID=2633591 RepID=UPI0024767DE2|nr:murein biosynthesis integral membrane protein MurJ [Kitasatospora sp. GAS204B]MDH6121653.1 putative peptidoglycan lipid II flippase [Kitasatospora sp. GAS204B]